MTQPPDDSGPVDTVPAPARPLDQAELSKMWRILSFRRFAGYVLMVLTLPAVPYVALSTLHYLHNLKYTALERDDLGLRLLYAQIGGCALVTAFLVLYLISVLRLGERMTLPHWLPAKEARDDGTWQDVGPLGAAIDALQSKMGMGKKK